MAYHVADASKLEWEDRPPGAEGQQPRRAADVTSAAGLQHSRGRVWRYPAGTRGRRHADKAQEEVFVVRYEKGIAYVRKWGEGSGEWPVESNRESTLSDH